MRRMTRSAGGSTRRGQRTFPSEYDEDGHTYYGRSSSFSSLHTTARVQYGAYVRYFLEAYLRTERVFYEYATSYVHIL